MDDLLKQYLDLGLTPDQIQEMKSNFKTLQGRCRANNSGWLCKKCKIDCCFKGGCNVVQRAGYGKQI